MGRCRVVVPKVTRLPLSDGDYLDVKHALNAGEVRAIYTGMIKEQRFGEAASADPARTGLTRMLQYVVGWSLVDLDGSPLAFTEQTLLAQDVETFNEINAALDAHILSVEIEEDALKKTRNGLTPSVPTLPSVG